MTAFDEIKKALVAAEQFIVNGVELGYIRMPNPETPDSAHDTLPMIRQAQTALKSLQRENEELERVIAGLNKQLTEQFELSTKYVARAETAEAEVKRLTAPETIECACTKVAQDETCPVGYPSLLCETCDGKGVLPYVELDGPELWEIVFGVNDDVAGEITDEQYDQIAKAINDVFIAPLRARKTLASTGGEHNAE